MESLATVTHPQTPQQAKEWEAMMNSNGLTYQSPPTKKEGSGAPTGEVKFQRSQGPSGAGAAMSNGGSQDNAMGDGAAQVGKAGAGDASGVAGSGTVSGIVPTLQNIVATVNLGEYSA